jgi:DNA-binding transcriptional regulator LsrR (DeoR family)
MNVDADRREQSQPEQGDQHAVFELLARIASLYYLEERTQSEIAREVGLSRQKVQRLLRQAREQRIVEIHVHTAPVLHMELENRLKETFHLSEAIVAPSHPDERHCRMAVARAAASYLERHLSDGMTVTVGLGRNMSETAGFFRPSRAIDCTFVSAMGGSPYMGESINPNNICSNLAAQARGHAQSLYAPAYVEGRRARDMLIVQDTIRETLTQAKRADLAILGIGTPTDDAILVQAGCLSVAEAQRLREIGAVGEVLGNYFDEEGREITSDLDERLIGLTLKDLQRIPKVIAVAGETEKSRAILGALRTGAVGMIVTECKNALAVLRLAGVTDLAEEDTLLGNGTGYL